MPSPEGLLIAAGLIAASVTLAVGVFRLTRRRPHADDTPVLGNHGLGIADCGPPSRQSSIPNPQPPIPNPSEPALATRICAAFDTWLAEHEDQPDLWAPFDQLIRELLTEHLGARRVRCYHVRAGCDTLQTLSQTNQVRVADCGSGTAESAIVSPQSSIHNPQLRSGVLGHTATTGKEFVADDPSHGPLVDHLANPQSAIGSPQSLDRWAWVWPVREGNATVGVVAVGELPGPPTGGVGPLGSAQGRLPSPTSDAASGLRTGRPSGNLEAPCSTTLLSAETRRTIGRLISLCWRYVACLERLRGARRIDQASGVLTRNEFFALAGDALADSYQAHEPVVVAVLALEGLRHLDDTGRWHERDALIDRLGHLITRRVRSDDLVGRFADDRFVVLLRRLDSGLGRLIAEQMHASATHCVASGLRAGRPEDATAGPRATSTTGPATPSPDSMGDRVCLRIGLAGSGFAQPALEELLEAAFEAVLRARKQNLPIWTDLEAVSGSQSSIINRQSPVANPQPAIGPPQSDSRAHPPGPTEATQK